MPIRQIQLNQEPSLEDKEELEAFYARTLERIEKAAAMLMSREPRLAEEFIREKEQINVESRRSRKKRLEKPLSVQSASSNVGVRLPARPQRELRAAPPGSSASRSRA